jgi:hypothetical protein
MRRLLVAAALASVISLGLVNEPVARAAPVLNVTMPFNQIVPNACAGGDATLTMKGQIHLVAAGVLGNTTHAKAHVNIKGTAVDSAGITYQVIEVGNGEVNTNFPLNQTGSIGEASIEASALLVSQGQSPNLVSHAVMHVVGHFDTGVATGVVMFESAKCQG